MVTYKIGQKMVKIYLKLVFYEPFVDTNYQFVLPTIQDPEQPFITSPLPAST